MLAGLDGYKTHITAGIMAIVAVLFGLGYIDREAFLTIMGLLGAGGLAALRNGVKKETAKVEQTVEQKVDQAATINRLIQR